MSGIQPGSATVEEIEAWLTEHVAATMKVAPATLDQRMTFEQFGMGSLESVGLMGALEEWLGRPLEATMAWDYPTIATLAAHLATTGPQPSGATGE